MTSFFLSSNVEREEAFGGAAVVDEQREREGTARVFPALSVLPCACLEWADEAEEWLIPAFRLTRSNF